MAEDDALKQRLAEDEKLIRRAEKALTEIKVAQGLSEDHAGVLAALRIHLKGDAGKSLEELVAAAGDLGSPELEDLLEREEPQRKQTLDDVLAQKPRPKREWPSG